jgi:hypothetical protein
MIEAMKQMYQLLLTEPHAPAVCDQLELMLREAISELEQRSIAELESQEPVATVTSETGADITMSWWHEPALPIGTKLFTHPPRRTWVGLTDEDISSVIMKVQEMYHRPPIEIFARGIEAKLKEKNT